jgi:hypothetical protein
MGLTKDLGSIPRAITVSNSNNVGVGNTSAIRRLEVASDGSNWISGTFSGTGNTNKVVIGNLTNPTIGGHNAALNAWSDFTVAGVNINFSPYGATAMRLFDNGNLFIGSSPSDAGFRLDVNGTGRFSGSVRIGNIDFGTNQVLSLAPGVFGIDAPGVGNGRFVINGSGNVGIGTTTDNGARLRVNGSIEVIPSNGNNAKIRWVTCSGDGGTNTAQVYWNLNFGSKAAGGCLGAYDQSGNYVSPSTTISGSQFWTIYGFIGV